MSTRTKTITHINHDIKTQLKESRIPAFVNMSKYINLESFFLDNQKYRTMFGNHYPLLERIVKSSISATAVKTIQESNTCNTLAGVWDNYTIYNIAAVCVTFMKCAETETYYFTYHPYEEIDEKDLQQLNHGTYMPFNEYNPNRFRQIYNLMIQNIISVMKEIIANKIPKAWSISQNKTLEETLTASYSNIMKPTIDEFLQSEIGSDLTITNIDEFLSTTKMTDKKVRQFIEYFERQFAWFLSIICSESGLSAEIILYTFEQSNLHIFYDDPSGKTANNIKIIYTMISEDKSTKFEFFATVHEIIVSAYYTTEYDKLCTLNNARTFGAKLKNMITNICSYTINLYANSLKAVVKE